MDGWMDGSLSRSLLRCRTRGLMDYAIIIAGRGPRYALCDAQALELGHDISPL